MAIKIVPNCLSLNLSFKEVMHSNKYIIQTKLILIIAYNRKTPTKYHYHTMKLAFLRKLIIINNRFLFHKYQKIQNCEYNIQTIQSLFFPFLQNH